MLADAGPSWPQVGPKLAPSWPQVGPCWPKLVQVSPNWPHVGPKMAPSWPTTDPLRAPSVPRKLNFEVQLSGFQTDLAQTPDRPVRAPCRFRINPGQNSSRARTQPKQIPNKLRTAPTQTDPEQTPNPTRDTRTKLAPPKEPNLCPTDSSRPA